MHLGNAVSNHQRTRLIPLHHHTHKKGTAPSLAPSTSASALPTDSSNNSVSSSTFALPPSSSLPPPPPAVKRTRGAIAAAAAAALAPKAPPVVELPKQVTLSAKDSAPQLSFSRDLAEVTGCRSGYRMAKGSDCVYSGNWYWECEVLDPPVPPAEDAETPHYRLGWSTKQGDTQSFVGYDKHSFGYRDVEGSKVHKSDRVDGYGEAFGPGDVIGFLICLPDLPEHMQETSLNTTGPVHAFPHPSPFHREESLNNSTIASDDGIEDEVLRKELAELGNHIRFFKNGKDQGPAFTQIPGARYYPAVSLYMMGKVRVNFGPLWICAPETGIPFSPMSDLKEPLKKDDLQAYNQGVNERKAAFAARQEQPVQKKEEEEEAGESSLPE